MCIKELVFKYFKDNPNAVEAREDVEHYSFLGVKKSTYHNCKMEYREILQARESSMLKLRNPEKYFRGKPRKKFIFDDSKL